VTCYYIYPKDPEQPSRTIELTEDEWFSVFLKAEYLGEPLAGIVRADDPTKCVMFAENYDGPELS
jgi:hypothetical protein